VTYTVIFISDDGCESLPTTYTFTINPEPVIDETTTEYVACSDDPIDVQFMEILPGNTASFINNFQVEVSVASGLIFSTPNVAVVNDGDVLSGNADVIRMHQWTNATTTSLDVVYTVTAISNDGCESDPVDFTVTIEPVVTLTVTANGAAATELITNAPVVTICSGADVAFALSQSLTDDTEVSYRIFRDLAGAPDVVDGQGAAPDNFEGGLAVANFTETLLNNGTSAQQVVYALRAYTYGANGEDDNGGGNQDDCLGPVARVIVEVLPAVGEPSDLQVNYVDPSLPQNQQFLGVNVETDTVCNNQPIGWSIGTPLSGNVGFRFSQTNDGQQPEAEIFGDFSDFSNNGINFTRINSTASNNTLAPITYTYTFTLYTFGPDGEDDQLAAGSDDCPNGITRTQTIYVLPTPELSADITAGDFTGTITSDDEAYFYELCAGDDFSLSNLMFNTADAVGRLKFVEFEVASGVGQSQDFLGLTPGTVEVPASAVLISQNAVVNTTNAPYTELITLTPFYEDNDLDCAGPSLT
ncbi:MAG: PKD-like domain-containing protein, partial [Bacteroidota bacterium]